MRARRSLIVIVTMALAAPTLCQLTYPDCYIQDVDWTSGEHHIVMPQPIHSPGNSSLPTSISGMADAEFVSATQVHLTDGFHAGGLSGNGRFRGYIDANLGDPDDLVVITTTPGSEVIDDVVHVKKWEKFELGFKLPQEYQDAIDSFFAHYYSNGTNQAATPDSVDTAHDLNPYADDSLRFDMVLTSPSGVQRLKYGFYMKEAKWASPSPVARLAEDPSDPLHPYHVRYRFSPDEEGDWQLTLSIKAPYTTTLANTALAPIWYAGYSFVCDAPLDDNHGPLHVNTVNRRTLQFEDGTAFFALGTNVPDKHANSGNGVNWYTYYARDFQYMTKSMEELHSVGGNFVRLWFLKHIFGPEWVNLGVYDHYTEPGWCANGNGLAYESNGQWQSWAFDQMLDSARKYNIQVQLCVDPYPGIIDYEYHWGVHPYVLHYLEPARRTPPDNPYDMKRMFYSYAGDSTSGAPLHESGVFYYWKRKYKYIMSRWGYSVNLPIIEPFNEIDQMLSYRHVDQSPPTDAALCDENKVDWAEDTQLPATYNNWLTDIISYVKDSVDFSNPVSSPLGESTKLFLTGIGFNSATTNPDYYLPCKNPKLDLVDVHSGNQWEWNMKNNFDASEAYRDSFVNVLTQEKRPFRQGEFTTFADDTIGGYSGTYRYFNNYDVSFHNELWASTFFGNFGAGASWAYERVFWWPNSLPLPPTDTQNQFQTTFFNALGATNILDVGGDSIRVKNRKVYHHFKPLSDLLNKPNWLAYDFFSDNFTAHRHSATDEANKIECYYLMNTDSTVAIGWVHNLYAYWGNSYYATSQAQRYLECAAPTIDTIALPGFAAETDFYISYFSTHMNDTICPANDVDSTFSGTVTLDLSSAPLSGQIGTPLDTLHSDYAFIISPAGHVKGRRSTLLPDTVTIAWGWNFELYPNPARGDLFLSMPDEKARDISILDLIGKRVRTWSSIKGPVVHLRTDDLAMGAYWLQVSDGLSSRTKKLIVH